MWGRGHSRWLQRLELGALATAAGALAATPLSLASESKLRLAQVTVHAEREGCEVELDVGPAAKTDVRGNLVLRDIDPSDHYVHVRCPGEQERGYLVSPAAGQNLELQVDAGSSKAPPDANAALELLEVKIELRRLVQQAMQSRAQGRFQDAVQNLREALRFDPDNSDLHRELGITFLLDKNWKSARVEMLEAIRHKQDDADAYNGLGYALEKLGDLNAAIAAYRTATKLDPEDSSYRLHYLEALGRLGAGPPAGKQQGRR